MKRLAFVLAGLLALTLANISEAAPLKRKVCVFDIAGAVGPLFGAMKDYRAAAVGWGLDVELIPYTSERIAAEDLKAGRCQAAVMTGLRARQFNKYTGTIDAIGAVPSTAQLKVLLHVLADPRMAAKQRGSTYEVLGIAPAGGAYIFVDDRKIDTLSKAAGKKVAVLDFDKTQAELVAQVGATPVPSDITNFASKFNNGVVDIIAAPLVAYAPLELYKGLNPNGGIIDYPLVQLTIQMVGYNKSFPEDIAQKSREYFFQNFDRIIDGLNKAAQDVDKKWWVQIPAKDKQNYELLMQQARVKLRDEGYYDPAMLTLERKVRCKFDPSRPECTNIVE